MNRTPQETKSAFAEDHTTFDADLNRTLKGGRFLTEDVTQNDLTKMADKQLEGRLAYYEKEYTFERDRRRAAEFKAEVDRSRIELNRRRMYARTEAERVFAL